MSEVCPQLLADHLAKVNSVINAYNGTTASPSNVGDLAGETRAEFERGISECEESHSNYRRNNAKPVRESRRRPKYRHVCNKHREKPQCSSGCNAHCYREQSAAIPGYNIVPVYNPEEVQCSRRHCCHGNLSRY